MKISQFQEHLDKVSQLNFVQPNGNHVPRHFHITEAGLTTKHFIDCGGTVRTEKKSAFNYGLPMTLTTGLIRKNFKKS